MDSYRITPIPSFVNQDTDRASFELYSFKLHETLLIDQIGSDGPTCLQDPSLTTLPLRITVSLSIYVCSTLPRATTTYVALATTAMYFSFLRMKRFFP